MERLLRFSLESLGLWCFDGVANVKDSLDACLGVWVSCSEKPIGAS